MKILPGGANNISTTIKAIERHLIPQSTAAPVPFRASKLAAEWQQRGPETFSGHALRKLRLSFPSTHSATIAGAVA
jgi:hypothetical protein